MFLSTHKTFLIKNDYIGKRITDMDMETKQLKRRPVGIQTFSAYWHHGGAHTHWPCGHGDAHGQGIVSL